MGDKPGIIEIALRNGQYHRFHYSIDEFMCETGKRIIDAMEGNGRSVIAVADNNDHLMVFRASAIEAVYFDLSDTMEDFLNDPDGLNIL